MTLSGVSLVTFVLLGIPMLFRPQPRFDHVLHSDARVTGDLSFAGALLMEGQQTGALEGQGDKTTVLVRGQVTGNVTVTHVHVEGTVIGDISAHTLVVKAGGRVRGNVKACSVHLEAGGAIDGQMETVYPAKKVSPAAGRPDTATASVARERLVGVLDHSTVPGSAERDA